MQLTRRVPQFASVNSSRKTVRGLVLRKRQWTTGHRYVRWWQITSDRRHSVPQFGSGTSQPIMLAGLDVVQEDYLAVLHLCAQWIRNTVFAANISTARLMRKKRWSFATVKPSFPRQLVRAMQESLPQRTFTVFGYGKKSSEVNIHKP